MHLFHGCAEDIAQQCFCDKNSDVINSTIAESRFKKKHNTLTFHEVREAIAANITQIADIHCGENLVDLLTKSLTPTKYIH